MLDVSNAKLTAKPALPAFEDRPNGFVSRMKRTSENVGRTRCSRMISLLSSSHAASFSQPAFSASSLEWKCASGSNGTTNVCCTVGIFTPWRLPQALARALPSMKNVKPRRSSMYVLRWRNSTW